MVSSVRVQLLLRVPRVCYQLPGLTCFLLAAPKKPNNSCLDKFSAFLQVLMLRVGCLIYIWIIITRKDQNSQASVTWKCNIESLDILGWLSSSWAPEVGGTKARGNKVKIMGAGWDVHTGDAMSTYTRLCHYFPTVPTKELALSTDFEYFYVDIFALCCPVGILLNSSSTSRSLLGGFLSLTCTLITQQIKISLPLRLFCGS